MSTNSDLIDYYANLLILQYLDKPKANATIKALVKQALPYELLVSIRDGFSIEGAIGVQLDTVAKYVGADREAVGTAFDRAYWGAVEYNAVSPFDFSVCISYGDIVPDVQIRNYTESSQSLYSLTDAELRTIIKLSITKNYSNGSVYDIDTILDALFGTDVYFNDRQNMTYISYLISSTLERMFVIAKAENALPKPAGVGIAITVVDDIDNIFGYSDYYNPTPSFAVGYGEYDTALTGCMAAYPDYT